jgi:hypothetical protein
MRNIHLMFLPLLLAACASPTIEPYAVEVTDKAQYTADLVACARYAQAYSKPLSLSAIGESGIKGAASNASSAAVNVLVPVLGAAGNATTELLNELDLLSTQQRAVFVKCWDKKTERDRSALVLEPNS